MGPTLHWREEPPDRSDRSFGREITFGAGKNSGRGYMAYSDRVGPGVVILAPAPGAWIRRFADGLNDDGFTVLVPDLAGEQKAMDVAVGAADHLTDNWHPRLGLVGIGEGSALAAELAGTRVVDALAFYEPPDELDLSRVAPPMVIHQDASEAAHEATAELFHYELS